ncbi:MAG: UDP-3-O-(3-hydroxymyristoyl)glucosamine N-acyltransferase [Alphaproteobacteria bacterium]|nr:UDP-3-O-(3-hydroxymyristoyl)glucosamine N-acyltransferase [Alphaproteobacteria bacterium]
MADPKFFHKIEGGLTLSKIAEVGEVVLPEGVDANKTFQDVADLEKATPDDVSWAFIPSVREALKNTKAGAVIVPEKFKEFVPSGTIALVSQDAHRSYGLVASAFYPRVFEAGISPAAHVDPTAKIGQGCRIAAGAVIEKDVVLGDGCDIHANAVIEEGVQMGMLCTVGANATVSHCIAGHKVYIYPGAQVGQDGFGFAMSPTKGPQKCPQLGRVIIGDDVEIGSCTTVDRGAMGDTEIGSGCRIDNLCQIAHNVKLGRCCVIVAQNGIAGSCEFGDGVVSGGQAGYAGHLKIGSGAQIAAQSGVIANVEPMKKMMGAPAQEGHEFMRQVVALRGLTKKKTAQVIADVKIGFWKRFLKKG